MGGIKIGARAESDAHTGAHRGVGKDRAHDGHSCQTGRRVRSPNKHQIDDTEQCT